MLIIWASGVYVVHQIWCRILVGSRGDESSCDESSCDESLEEAFQKPPLKGDRGSGPPEKLGEVISSVHAILVAKYVRAILNERTLKAHKAKGLLMDKELGCVHICLVTDEWEENCVLHLKCELLTDYVHLSKKRICYHLTKLTRSPSPDTSWESHLFAVVVFCFKGNRHTKQKKHRMFIVQHVTI